MAGLTTPILSKTEFVGLFRPLVGAEDALADLLLMAASKRIRRKFVQAGADLDETDEDVKLVVFEIVRDVIGRGDFAVYSSVTVSTDDSTESRVFANPSAALTITDAHWVRLGLDLSPDPRGCFPVGDY